MENKFRDLLNTSYGDLLKKEVPVQAPKGYLLLIKNNRVLPEEILIDGRLDNESCILIDTFNSMLENVFSMSMSNPLDQRLDYAKNIQHDFGALISYLSRVFEIEMNNSIVQWYRRSKGIKMPDNYKKVDDDFGPLMVRIYGDQVNLNRATKDDRWASLELGKLLYMLTQYRSEFPEDIQQAAMASQELWEKIRSDRNASSHTELIDEQRFTVFYDTYCSMVKSGWFTKIMDIKQDVLEGAE